MAGSIFQLESPIEGLRSDLVFLHTDSPYVMTTASQELFVDGGKMAAGAYKLLQQVVLALFTAIGGVPLYRSRGTELAASIARSGIQNEATMRTVFAISREQVLSEFADRQSRRGDLLPTERLTDLVLRSLRIEGDTLYLELELRTAANQILQIILPVSHND